MLLLLVQLYKQKQLQQRKIKASPKTNEKNTKMNKINSETLNKTVDCESDSIKHSQTHYHTTDPSERDVIQNLKVKII